MNPDQQQRILGYFIEEAKDHLNTMEQGLLNLQATLDDPELVNELFRAAHSVKGGAAMLGIRSIQHISHRLEDYFKILKECPGIRVDQQLESLLLRCFDPLSELLEQLQRPFGLTEEASTAALTEAEPLFNELQTHLEQLVAQSSSAAAAAAARPEVPQAVVAAAALPERELADQEELSALQLVFRSDVTRKLRVMLGLFKQPDRSDSRAQIQSLCNEMRGMGEQFDLSGWCNLCAAAQEAVANLDNAYRDLAMTLIREFKQAQDLVLNARAAEVAIPSQLQAMLPIAPAEPETDLLPAEFLASAGPDLDQDLDLDLDLELDLGLDLATDSTEDPAPFEVPTHSSVEDSLPELSTPSAAEDFIDPFAAAELEVPAAVEDPWGESMPSPEPEPILDFENDLQNSFEVAEGAPSTAVDYPWGELSFDDDIVVEVSPRQQFGSLRQPPTPEVFEIDLSEALENGGFENGSPSESSAAPQVGETELDSLAALFGSENLDLGDVWGSENAPLGESSLSDSSLADFSDLLGPDALTDEPTPAAGAGPGRANANYSAQPNAEALQAEALSALFEDIDTNLDHLFDDEMPPQATAEVESPEPDSFGLSDEDSFAGLDLLIEEEEAGAGQLTRSGVDLAPSSLPADLDTDFDSLFDAEPEAETVREAWEFDDADDFWASNAPEVPQPETALPMEPVEPELPEAPEVTPDDVLDEILDEAPEVAPDEILDQAPEFDAVPELSLDEPAEMGSDDQWLALLSSEEPAEDVIGFADVDQPPGEAAQDASLESWLGHDEAAEPNVEDFTNFSFDDLPSEAATSELDSLSSEAADFDFEDLLREEPTPLAVTDPVTPSESELVAEMVLEAPEDLSNATGFTEAWPEADEAVAEAEAEALVEAEVVPAGEDSGLEDLLAEDRSSQDSTEDGSTDAWLELLSSEQNLASLADLDLESPSEAGESLDLENLLQAQGLELDPFAEADDLDLESLAQADGLGLESLSEAEELDLDSFAEAQELDLASLLDSEESDSLSFTQAAADEVSFDDLFGGEAASPMDRLVDSTQATEESGSDGVEEFLGSVNESIAADDDADDFSADPFTAELADFDWATELNTPEGQDAASPLADLLSEEAEAEEVELDLGPEFQQEFGLEFGQDAEPEFDLESLQEFEFSPEAEQAADEPLLLIMDLAAEDEPMAASLPRSAEPELETPEPEGVDSVAGLMDFFSSSNNEFESASDELDLDLTDDLFNPRQDLINPGQDLNGEEDAVLGTDSLLDDFSGLLDENGSDWGETADLLDLNTAEAESTESTRTFLASPDLSPAAEPSAAMDDLAELDALLSDLPEASPRQDRSAATDLDFQELEALLSLDEPAAPPLPQPPRPTPPVPPLPSQVARPPAAVPQEDATGFAELEKMLEEADQTMGGPPTAPGNWVRPSTTSRMTNRRQVAGYGNQTMRVEVKHLDNLNNLVGELVVNRNSLEQDQDRLRQSLDNLLHQVQQLGDVGQRLQDQYERSLLESSLLASRQGQSAPSTFLTDRMNRAAPQSTHAMSTGFDALEMDRFTSFHTLSQEIIELIVRVRESSSDIEFIVEETELVARQFRQVTTQLQEGLTRSRMVPFAQIADRLPRAVRDIAIKTGKKANIEIEGRETLIDKAILEQLYDPMTHLVNNALTHGIEDPQTRQSLGKPVTGRILVRAFHQGNQTVISVSDDGAGIHSERVKAKAIEKRLLTPTQAASMTYLDVYDLLFHPGFSTADQVDDLKGRGVGMDVVRTSLNDIRGSISTDSSQGQGTTFTIRLPLTLSISKAMVCISNHANIAFPMDGVEDMLDVPKDRVQIDAEGRPTILWREMPLPFCPLSDLLSYNRYISRGSIYSAGQDDNIISVVILRSASHFVAVEVQQVVGEQEIVIKQLEGPVPKPMGVAGATVLADGRVMPIADVLELIDLALGRARRDPSQLWDSGMASGTVEELTVESEPTVLIVDDSITVRELLSMTFNKVGYRVEQARDGQEAWEKLRGGMPCNLVFCDIEMPRMNGLELLSRLQKDDILRQIPIAMLTSRGADRHRQLAIQEGASGYFTKPYLEEELLHAASRMLKGERLV